MKKLHIVMVGLSGLLIINSAIPSLRIPSSCQQFRQDNGRVAFRWDGVVDEESVISIGQERSGRDNKQTEARLGLRWWGRVDGRDLLRIRRAQVWIVHEEGFPVVEADYRLERPMPTEPVTVTARKVRGRGTVQVVEQPSRDNNYTATILIEDKKSGSDQYKIEVYW